MIYLNNILVYEVALYATKKNQAIDPLLGQKMTKTSLYSASFLLIQPNNNV